MASDDNPGGSGDGLVEPSDIFARHANLCRVFVDEKRLRIMWFLGDGPQSVTAIAEHIGATLQNTSQHLRVMRDRGAVRRTKVGQTVYYRTANPKLLQGCHLIREGIIEELNRALAPPTSDADD